MIEASGSFWSDLFNVVQGAALIGTLLAVVYQIRDNNKAQRYQIYQKLNDRYTELLWRGANDPVLNDVWEILPDERVRQLQAAQQQKEWGAWFELSADERRQYRLTRLALEIFEQVYVAKKKGWVARDLWPKWNESLKIWCRSRFFDIVFEDTKSRLQNGFVLELEKMCTEQLKR